MSSQPNYAFTIKFFDKDNNYVAQYDYNGILSASNLAQLEANVQPFDLQLQFYLDGSVSEPETDTVSNITTYITNTIQNSIGSRIYSSTTMTAAFAGEIPGENVMFDIALPDGTVLHNQVVTVADYQSLAEDPIIASVTNVISTTAPVTITFAQISAHYTTQTTPQPSTVSNSSPLPTLKKLVIFSQVGVNYEVELDYQDGTVSNYTLSQANVDYWLRNTQSVVDQTGLFVPNTSQGTQTPTPTPSNTTQSPSSTTTVDQTNAAIQQAQTIAANLQTQLSSSQSAQTQLQTQIASLTTEINSLTSAGNTDTAQYSQTLQALQDANSQLQTLQSQDATTKQDLATATANINSLTQQVQLLLSQINAQKIISGANNIPIVITALGFVGLGLGIAAIDPKKKTLAEVVHDKITRTVDKIKDKTDKVYCKKCHRDHNKDHKHIHLGFDKLKNKIKKEYEKKGDSPEKAEKIGEETAGKVAREVAAE